MGLFDKFIKDVGKVAAGAGQTVSHIAQVTGNALKPSELVKDLPQIPGALLNVGLAPLHAAALTAGGAAELVGGVVHNNALLQAGKDIIHTDAEVADVIQKDPLNSGKVVVGGGLIALGTVTGIAMGPGIALAAAGTAGLIKDVARREAEKTTSQIPKPVEVAPQPAPAGPKLDAGTASGVPRAAMWPRVRAWVSFRFGHGKGIA